MTSLSSVLQEARHGHRGTSVGPNQVRSLIAALRGEGIEPADAKAFDRLSAAEPSNLAVPPRLLELSPQAFADLAVDGALREEARHRIEERLHGQRAQFAAEVVAAMRAEVDDYLARLTGTFDEAAEHAHGLVRLGIKATDQPADLLRRSSEVVSAALLFQDKYALALDRVANVRVQISLVLGIEPGGWVEDMGAAFMEPLVPGLFDYRRGYGDAWRRWISIAERAELRLLTRREVHAAAQVQRQPLIVEDEDGRLVNTA